MEDGNTLADIVQLDDVIIDGSLCVGNDCVTGEDFGYDTIMLKENNLRIYFNDTSSIAGYATKSRKTMSPMDVVALLTKVVQNQRETMQRQQKAIDELTQKIERLDRKIK